MNILTTTWKALKFPLKLITGWLKGKPKKSKNELREKQLRHVRNFDPTRLNNRSWQKSIGKKQNYKKKRKRKQEPIKPN